MENKNAITTINAEKIAKTSGLSVEEVAIIKSTIAKGVSDVELAFFLSVAKSAELNPFNREVWCYKDNKANLLIFSGRDGFLSKAQRNPLFNGIRSCEVCRKDSFSIDIANNKINHQFGIEDRGEIVGAYAIVFRKYGEPTIEYADIKTYDKKQYTWNTHKAAMIKKVAETNALKKAFGISGIQSEYEFDIHNDIATPIMPNKDELSVKLQELIELIDKLPADEQTVYKEILAGKRQAGELNLSIVNNMIEELRVS